MLGGTAVLGTAGEAAAYRPPPRKTSEESKPPPAVEDQTVPEASSEDAGTQGQDESAEQPMEPRVPIVPGEGTLGFAGVPLGASETTGSGGTLPRETVAVTDRWRIGWLPWNRYGRQAPGDDIWHNWRGGDSPYTLGHPLNPYDRNVLKGDYPIAGQDIFLNFTAVSDTFVQWRELPTPSGVSAASPGSFDIFNDGRQFFFNQTFLLSFDVFKGYTAYRPVDWLFRVSPAFNINYLEVQERNVVNVNPEEDEDRGDEHALLQEMFYEKHLGDMSPYFDVASLKVGRQLFVSDFRGFIFNDVSDGVRLSGNFEANRLQYNLALFNQVEKDTNSELNELNWRDQQVLIANLFIQDFIWLGYTTQFSFHWNHDRSDDRYDENGFQVRPDLIGSVTLQELDAYYLGWASDGHIGRLNVSHALYSAFGTAKDNALAGRDVDIAAYLGALELSVDVDWLRPKISFLYASGDEDPEDDTGGGFDGIFDNPVFAGGPSSFFQQSGFGIFGVRLTSPRSLYNDLSASKAEGQANFVNPGTMILNAGFDAELTPKLRASFNANSIHFADTSSLELFLNQNDIDEHLGDELNLVLQYRPLLNNNIIISVGGSLFYPAEGFDDIYGSQETLYQVFTALTVTY